MTRREILAAGAAAAVAPAAFAQGAAPGLNALAKAKGMRFGSCVSTSPPGADRGSWANPAYAALLERDCGILVPENEFKWQALRPDAAHWNFDRFNQILAYAGAHAMPVRGHTLLWHKTQRFPLWLLSYDFGPNPRAAAEQLLWAHIKACTQYPTLLVPSYDVVNEAVDEKTGGLRESNLSAAFGGAEAMLDFAFHKARECAPAGAQLVYNDYMDWEPGSETHCAGVLRLLEGFRKRNVPVDALGLQSHIGVRSADPVAALVARQSGPWRKFLDAVVAMGYKLVITEFDVNDNGLPADHAARDRAVADYAKAYLDICFDYGQLRDVLAWGMCDRYSWLNGFSPRADGERKRSTPYDEMFQPKPLYTAIAEAFAGAPSRG